MTVVPPISRGRQRRKSGGDPEKGEAAEKEKKSANGISPKMRKSFRAAEIETCGLWDRSHRAPDSRNSRNRRGRGGSGATAVPGKSEILEIRLCPDFWFSHQKDLN